MKYFSKSRQSSWLVAFATMAGMIPFGSETPKTAAAPITANHLVPATPQYDACECDRFCDIAEAEKVAPLAGSRVFAAFYVLLEDRIFFLGGSRDRAAAIFLVRVDGRDEALRLKKALQARHTYSPGDRLPTGAVAGFKIVQVQDEREQEMMLNMLRAGTAADGRERGTFIRLRETAEQWWLELDPGITVGDARQVGFRFLRKRDGAISLFSREGHLRIATLHLHTHDRGLSGANEESTEGESDMRNVRETAIPWLTAGPGKLHVGFLSDYNQLQMQECNTVNVALVAFKGAGRRLGAPAAVN